MKMKRLSLIAAFVCASITIQAQGTFVYDQQSADENHYLDGIIAFGFQPLGQSFTPAFDRVGFIRIYIYGGGSGTFSVNLRADSIMGTILASTTPVSITTGGPTDFFFPTPVPVTPGTTYYFEPKAPGSWNGGIFAWFYNYPGGTAILNGNADSRDFWFREGVVVPEPSSVSLLALGSGIFFWTRKLRRR